MKVNNNEEMKACYEASEIVLSVCVCYTHLHMYTRDFDFVLWRIILNISSQFYTWKKINGVVSLNSISRLHLLDFFFLHSTRKYLLYLFIVVTEDSVNFWVSSDYLLLPISMILDVGWESKWSNTHTLTLSATVPWNPTSDLEDY